MTAPHLRRLALLLGGLAMFGPIVGRTVIRDLLHGEDAQRLISQVSRFRQCKPGRNHNTNETPPETRRSSASAASSTWFPAVGGSRVPLNLAFGAAVFAFLGWAFWRWEMQAGHRVPDGSSIMPALEPTDRM